MTHACQDHPPELTVSIHIQIQLQSTLFRPVRHHLQVHRGGPEYSDLALPGVPSSFGARSRLIRTSSRNLSPICCLRDAQDGYSEWAVTICNTYESSIFMPRYSSLVVDEAFNNDPDCDLVICFLDLRGMVRSPFTCFRTLSNQGSRVLHPKGVITRRPPQRTLPYHVDPSINQSVALGSLSETTRPAVMPPRD